MMKCLGRLLLAGSLCFVSGCLGHTAFRGGQLTKIRVARFFNDYLAEFPELDLNKNGYYTAVFRGFPSSPAAYLDLGIIDSNSGDKESLTRFTSEIAMELHGEKGGHMICRATGKLNRIKGVVDHHWILSTSVDSASFRNSDCQGLRIQRNESYTLKITITAATEGLGRPLGSAQALHGMLLSLVPFYDPRHSYSNRRLPS